VLVDTVLQRVVIVITDITAEMERQRVLAEQHEFAQLIDQFVRDQRAFRAFWTDTSTLVAKVVEASVDAPERLLRDVHTLKGNARLIGLDRISSLCHELETAMGERKEPGLKASERDGLSELWNSLRQRIEPLIQGSTAFIEVSREDYDRLLRAVSERKPQEQLVQLVRDLRHESVATRLERAKSQLTDTSIRLGKTPPRVEIRHDDVRLPAAVWAPFWSVLSHVLNNAVDHGVESDDERRALGKAVPASICLSARLLQGDVTIEVRDDGRGIDWDRVQQLAAERGIAHLSRTDLEQALFSDGFSLKHEVTETSGRGVGLAAVRDVVQRMGGRIELESTQRVGTTWRFHFSPTTLDDSSPEARKVSPLASVKEAHP
jgi:two-component system, chemotaxis family, sensor kinase CheA